MVAFIIHSVALSMVCCSVQFLEKHLHCDILCGRSVAGPGRKFELSVLLSRGWSKTGSGTYMAEPARIRVLALSILYVWEWFLGPAALSVLAFAL